MANAVIAAIQWGATWVSATAVNTAAAIGIQSHVALSAISLGSYWAATAGITVGLQVGFAAATAPKIEGAQANFKQSDPTRVRAIGAVRLGGPLAFWEASGNWSGDVVMLHDGRVDHFGQVYLFDDPVALNMDGFVQTLPNGAYPTGFVNISLREGLFTETVHDNIQEYFPSWTADHRGDGIASVGMTCSHGKMDEFNARYPNGAPAVSVEIFAQRIFDPRDPAQDVSDPDTWLWSRNAVLGHLFWEFYDQGKAYDWEVVGDRLVKVFNAAKWNRIFAPNLAMWVEAANVADEDVALKAGGTVDRYTVGAYYAEGQAPDAIRRQFLSAYDGWTSMDGRGAMVVYAGKYYAPTVTLGDDDVDDYTFQRFVEDEQSVNVLSLRYTEPTTGYTTAEPPAWRDTADIAARLGRERAEPLELPWVQSASQCRRLAKRLMARHQAVARGSIITKMTDAALDALGQRYVRLQISETSTLADLPVEIVRAQIDLMSMSILYEWIAVDPEIDAWDAANEEGEAPVTEERPDSEGVPVPDGLAIDAVFESVGAGGQGPRLVATFADPDRDDVSYVLRWKRSTDTAYNYEAFSTAEDAGGGDLRIKSAFVPADVTINASVAFVGGAGGQGEYAADQSVNTTTAGLSPGPATSVLAGNGAGQSVITWTNPASILFASAKVYRANSGQVFADAVAVSGDIVGAPSAAGTYTNTGVPAGSYLYWVVAKSTSGVTATPAGPDAATIT